MKQTQIFWIYIHVHYLKKIINMKYLLTLLIFNLYWNLIIIFSIIYMLNKSKTNSTAILWLIFNCVFIFIIYEFQLEILLKEIQISFNFNYSPTFCEKIFYLSLLVRKYFHYFLLIFTLFFSLLMNKDIFKNVFYDCIFETHYKIDIEIFVILFFSNFLLLMKNYLQNYLHRI